MQQTLISGAGPPRCCSYVAPIRVDIATLPCWLLAHPGPLLRDRSHNTSRNKFCPFSDLRRDRVKATRVTLHLLVSHPTVHLYPTTSDTRRWLSFRDCPPEAASR